MRSTHGSTHVLEEPTFAIHCAVEKWGHARAPTSGADAPVGERRDHRISSSCQLCADSGGFERLRPVEVLDGSGDLAISHREHVRQLHLYRDPAFSSMTAEAHPEEELVPASLRLQGLHREIGIRLDPAGELSPDGIDLTMDCGIGILADGVVFGAVQSGTRRSSRSRGRRSPHARLRSADWLQSPRRSRPTASSRGASRIRPAPRTSTCTGGSARFSAAASKDADAYPVGSGCMPECRDLVVGRRVVDRAEPEEGLKGGYRRASSVVTEDELVEVDGQVLI